MNLPKYIIINILNFLINHYPKYQLFYITKLINTFELVSNEFKNDIITKIPIKCRVLNKQSLLEVERLLKKGLFIKLSLHPFGTESLKSLENQLSLSETLYQVTFNYIDQYIDDIKYNLRNYSKSLKSLYIVNGSSDTISATESLFQSENFTNFNSIELEFSSMSPPPPPPPPLTHQPLQSQKVILNSRGDRINLSELLKSIDKSTQGSLKKFKFVNGSPDDIYIKGLDEINRFQFISKLLLVRITLQMKSLENIFISSSSSNNNNKTPLQVGNNYSSSLSSLTPPPPPPPPFLSDISINKIVLMSNDNSNELFNEPYDYLMTKVFTKNTSIKILKIFGTDSIQYSSIVHLLNENNTLKTIQFSFKNAFYHHTTTDSDKVNYIDNKTLTVKNSTLNSILLSFNQQPSDIKLPNIYHLWDGNSDIKDSKFQIDTWNTISKYHQNLKYIHFRIEDDNIEFFKRLISSNFNGLTSIKSIGITCESHKNLDIFIKSLQFNNHLEKITFYAYPITEKALNSFLKQNHQSIQILQGNLGGLLNIKSLKESLSQNTTLLKLNIMDISTPKQASSAKSYFNSLFKILERNQTLHFLSLPSPFIKQNSFDLIQSKLNRILDNHKSLLTLSLNLTDKQVINKSSGKVILF